MRGVTAIVTALCVLISSAYCACTAHAPPAAHAHSCCDHGGKSQPRPGQPHDPARDCPHCDGSAVTAAPPQSMDSQQVISLLPALACEPVSIAGFALVSPFALPHTVPAP